jgi:hypothetical protein
VLGCLLSINDGRHPCRTTAPCGTFTFTVTNNSQISEHNFGIIEFGQTRAVGDTIEPGGYMATVKVVLGPGGSVERVSKLGVADVNVDRGVAA